LFYLYLYPPQRLCLNGSTGQEVMVRKDLQNVEALTFDPISRLLYWVDAGAQKIEVPPLIVPSLFPSLFPRCSLVVPSLFPHCSLIVLKVSNPDGDLRHTLLNSSVLEHPRALVLLPEER